MMSDTAFDEYVQNYDEALERGISVSGDNKLTFVERRLRWLTQCLSRMGERPSSVLDFGCGIGDSSELIATMLGVRRYVGFDTSLKAIDYANSKFASADRHFVTPGSSISEYGNFDLAHCNGVFHHIPPTDRPRAAKYVFDSLRPGGLFALWENNPWNPGTRIVMSRIPFDRNAELLSVRSASSLLSSAGFTILQCRFLFIFPKMLKHLRFIEPSLSALPIGAQYQVLCRRP